MSTLAAFIRHSFGSPNQGNHRRKRKKTYPNWKRRSKTVNVGRLHDPIHENPKDATRKLPELINEFGKVIVYKINV